MPTPLSCSPQGAGFPFYIASGLVGVKGAVPLASLRGGLWPHRVGWLFALLSSVLSSATHWAQNCAQWLLGAFLALLDPRLPASPLRERRLKIALTFHLGHWRNFEPMLPPNGRNFAPVELHGCNHAVLLFTFAFLRFPALSRRRISQPPPALEGAGRVKCGTLYLSCLLWLIAHLCRYCASFYFGTIRLRVGTSWHNSAMSWHDSVTS